MSKASRFTREVNETSDEAMNALFDGHIFYGMQLDPEQEVFRDAIASRNTIAVVCNAKAGTGKTTIAIGVANLLYKNADRHYNGITYIVSPTMEQRQGFIPGDPEMKNKPYRQPLDDACIKIGLVPDQCIKSSDDLESMKSGNAFITFIADTYLRGINLENQIVIIDEAQNFYFNDLKKVLTRIHDNCKVIMIGHDAQCDIVKHAERGGFNPYLRALREIDDPRVAVCELHTNHRGWFSTLCDNVQTDGSISE